MSTNPGDREDHDRIDELYEEDEESNATEEGMPLPPQADPDGESGAPGA